VLHPRIRVTLPVILQFAVRGEVQDLSPLTLRTWSENAHDLDIQTVLE
jgi:hypothetical protein